jgi:hypothetical protein
MSQGISDEVKRELSAALRPTSEFSGRLWALGGPEFVAFGAAAEPDRNRSPQAHAAALHVALIVQLARYHLHLARYERLRHREYLAPPNPADGDVAAAFLFTSFAMHAIAVERHLTVALALRFSILNHQGTGPSGRINEVRRALADAGQQPFADVLAPFQHEADWQWLRQYRERWEHRDPPRIAEFGLQFSSKRAYWTEGPTTLPGGEPGRALELTITAGDPPETSVEEMLRRGVSCVNLLAAQVDHYIRLLETGAAVGQHGTPEVVSDHQ